MPQGIQIQNENGDIILDFTDSITRYDKTFYSEAKIGTYNKVEAFNVGRKEDFSRYWCIPRISRITDYFGVERGPFPGYNVIIATKDQIRNMSTAPQDWKDKRLALMDEVSAYVLLTSMVLVSGASAPDNSTINIDVGKY